jgi:hypothetical protein
MYVPRCHAGLRAAYLGGAFVLSLQKPNRSPHVQQEDFDEHLHIFCEHSFFLPVLSRV